MRANRNARPSEVPGPRGQPLTLETLPPLNTIRWTVHRKAEVVAAVSGGLLAAGEACKLYSISPEEFASWQLAVRRRGIRGLGVTQLRQYRREYALQDIVDARSNVHGGDRSSFPRRDAGSVFHSYGRAVLDDRQRQPAKHVRVACDVAQD
jgi:hypothetical protein